MPTCLSVPGWAGLRSNWTSLLKVQPDEFPPWYWGVKTKTPSTNSVTLNSSMDQTEHLCPSKAAKLGAFAAVNVAMVLIVPLVGRRTHGKARVTIMALHRNSFRICIYCQQCCQRTPYRKDRGFSRGLNIESGLTLVHSTPNGLDDHFIHSMAGGAGNCPSGTAINYARTQHFYDIATLDSAANAAGARLMYTRALFWIIAIVGVIFATQWSVLGIRSRTSGITNVLKNSVAAKLAGKHSTTARYAGTSPKGDSFQVYPLDEAPRDICRSNLRTLQILQH
ncbi:hypothetical protein B0J14DRAFT_705126 [Halenospora varia]|nr:hypothetical protein B0J14DRAFT_705126 [Halenospora varia]